MITIKHSCKRGLWSVKIILYSHWFVALKLLLTARSQRIKQGLLNNTFQLECCGFVVCYTCVYLYIMYRAGHLKVMTEPVSACTDQL